jgi:hypothetical protein
MSPATVHTIIGVAGNSLLPLPKIGRKESTASPALFVGQGGLASNSLQSFVIHRNRPINEIVVLG